MKSKLKLSMIIIAAVLSIVLMSVFGVQSSQNKVIGLSESVDQAKSDINVQEKRRVDLIYNLADCVKKYDSYEADTLTTLADNMSVGDSIESVNKSIAAIVYSYPDLKSDGNYKQLMKELATTENLIAQYRENYNASVTKYNRYVKKFPTRIFLSWTGYEVENYQRLEYNAPEDAPQNIFGD